MSGTKPFWVQWDRRPVRLRPRRIHDLRGYEQRHLPAGMQYFDAMIRLWALRTYGTYGTYGTRLK